MSQQPQKQNFLHGATLLAAATVIVKVIGAVYKIPLQAILGKIGYSYFSSAYDIYTLLLLISTAGLPVAVSRMISQANSLGNYNQVRKTYKVARLFFLGIGLVSSLILIIFSPWLAEKMGLAIDDAVMVTPVSFTGQPTESAPQVELTVIGVCSDPEHLMDEGIIVPEEIFLSGPRLLYNPDMMYDCYYRSFVLELEPSWNRSFETVEDSVKEILYDLDEFELVSNHRTLRRSVGPMERKLAVQEKLILPLELLFLMACAGISILICIGLETEIFLRRMWGETGDTVFSRLWCCITLWLMTCAATAIAVTTLTTGTQWLRWAIYYAGAGSIICAAVSAIPLFRSCRRNLVEFYQTKEGE